MGVIVNSAFAAQPPVGLGTADSFAVLAGSTVTNTGPWTVNGDLGVSPGTAVTGIPPGKVNGAVHAADAVAGQAQSDLTTAYNDAAGRTPALSVSGHLSGLTLTGEHFVEENVWLPAGQPGGPFALATSDRSNVLQEFDGGPGQIALHGLDNVGGQLGTAESHCCVRLADSAITWLAARIGPGVPITIT
jgi:lipoprotein-anchoring transpeptidase ErfK/SrfK